MELLGKVLSRENLLVALERVERNKGSAGIDGVSTEQLRDYIREHWLTIKEQIMKGTYKPSPVRRVEIPKTDGGVRLLGIPTVVDRFIQQAILQVLTPIFDPHFSKSSFGFRPNRSAHDAIRQAQSYISEGYRFVVDMDLEKFFDRVNHDILMSRVARKVQDKALLKLIRAYLQAGIMVNGICLSAAEGTPQGGPLSPLLANILLDDLDKELEKRGHRFCRYADDSNIYVKTKRAGERVKESIQNYLEKVLKLKVNEQKSAVDRPWKRKFLGFSFTSAKQVRIRLHPKSLLKLKEKIRFITNPVWSISMDERIQKLNQYLMGWIGYFALADAKKILQSIEEWVRRRLRLCLWSQWKRVRTRYRELRSLGLPHVQAIEIANTRKGAWRSTKTPQIHKALGVAYWQQQGLKSLVQRYSVIRQA
ncbi:group II intron reverse transcriptase/maturase [Brevibacillus nitrificans]|uniref:group II intron reverse transcriptase/maturase n=1 Tax=Brevibacillus nitrificans TaxID=651560 RepID=UPI0009BAC284|nr:group II intron reverse transcriptase/maturase [Brevibacillus nitrificans]KAB3587288.1 group II intron reverse transcriptase/maturase [Phocaeicola vulgatus]KAB3839791.1 group II intron reverse transcriptase/maturase [Phocaeicola vulgatus]MDR7319739.1 group II intron reverse transcriptase/maturase [Brevibacillus nitrificans]